MPSTYSDLKFELMATGENNTTWGDKTNVNLDAIEEAIAGSTNIVFASADVVLTLANTSASQPARNMRLALTGTTGGATRTLTIPAIQKMYMVINLCADPVIVKTAAGNPATVPPSKSVLLFCDGADTGFSTNFAGTMQVGNGLAGIAMPNGRLAVSERLGVGTTNPLAITHVTAAADGQNNFAVTALTKGVRIVPRAADTLIQGVDQALATAQPLTIDGATLQLNASAPSKGININAAGDTTVQGTLTTTSGLFANGADNVTLAAFTGATNRLRFYSSGASGNIVDSTNAAGTVYAPFVLGGSQITLIAQPANKGIVIASSGAATATGGLYANGADNVIQFGVSGATKGVRFTPSPTGLSIEGVDNTLTATFQPLTIGGSTVTVSAPLIVSGASTFNALATFSSTARFADGVVSSPSLGFTSETNTGFFRKALNTIGVALAGANMLEIASTGLKMLAGGLNLNWNFSNGISGVPGFGTPLRK